MRAYSIGRPLSSVCMYVCLSTFSNSFSSETSMDRGTKVCSNGPGHMTKNGRNVPIW